MSKKKKAGVIVAAVLCCCILAGAISAACLIKTERYTVEVDSDYGKIEVVCQLRVIHNPFPHGEDIFYASTVGVQDCTVDLKVYTQGDLLAADIDAPASALYNIGVRMAVPNYGLYAVSTHTVEAEGLDEPFEHTLRVDF